MLFRREHEPYRRLQSRYSSQQLSLRLLTVVPLPCHNAVGIRQGLLQQYLLQHQRLIMLNPQNLPSFHNSELLHCIKAVLVGKLAQNGLAPSQVIMGPRRSPMGIGNLIEFLSSQRHALKVAMSRSSQHGMC